jgi:hypothetical protein
MRVLINGEELVKIMDYHVCQRNLKLTTAIRMLLLTAPEQPDATTLARGECLMDLIVDFISHITNDRLNGDPLRSLQSGLKVGTGKSKKKKIKHKATNRLSEVPKIAWSYVKYKTIHSRQASEMAF